jgi:truncated hemoglobin YjbI
LSEADFGRWLDCFTATLDENFAGQGARRARRIAATIANNMQVALDRSA